MFLIGTWDEQGCSRVFPRRAIGNSSEANSELLVFHWFRWCHVSISYSNSGDVDWLNLIDLDYPRGTTAIKSESLR